MSGAERRRRPGGQLATLWTEQQVREVVRRLLAEATGTGGGAPTTAQYLVAALDGTLSAERLITDTARIAWDLSVGGVATADIVAESITAAEIAAANKDGAAGTASLRTLGAGSQQACAGDDARLSDARTPTAHTHPGTDITSLIIEPRTSDPASPEVGRVWLRTDL